MSLDLTASGLKWSDPVKIADFDGKPARRRSAPATNTFWDVYRKHKEQLRAAGYRVRKDDKTGAWIVLHYDVSETEEDRAERAAAIEASRATDAAVELPVPAGLAYLPYQKAGIAFAVERPATLIADEMGLGKTIQAIGVANVTGARRILVICPASLRLNWAKEMARWLTDKSITIGVVEASKDWPMTDVVIINYDILDRHHDRLRARPWDLMVADESHYLKNAKARRTRQVFGHKASGIAPIPAARRLLLTGTPIVNRPVELWPLISYLDPQTWTNFMRFARRYCAAHHNGYGWDFTGAAHLAELQDKLRATVMVRRLKKDVLAELPAKRRQVITLAANGAAGLIAREQEAMAEAERITEDAHAAVELAKADEDDTAYRAAIARLRAASAAAFTEISRLRHVTALAKVPYVLEHLENVGDDKVVVFAHHKDVVAQLEAGLAKHGKVAVITGDDALADRQAAVEAFQQDPAVRYFIGTIAAAGVGITLTAASHVVFAELDWVPGNVSQAEDRCHRIGQHDSVLVQHIVLDGSIDARLAQTILEKQAVIDAALDEAHAPRAEAPQPTVDWIKLQLATADVTRAKIAAEAVEISDAAIAAVHTGLRILAQLDPDHAGMLNDVGFNRLDGKIGHSLAACTALTKRQAALGRKLLKKYHRQIGADLIAQMGD